MKLSLIPALFNCFRKGSAVADVVKAKNWGALGIALGALIAALANAAKALGYDIHMDPDTASQIGTGLAAVAGLFVTYGTSKSVGFLPPLPASPVGSEAAYPIPAREVRPVDEATREAP